MRLPVNNSNLHPFSHSLRDMTVLVQCSVSTGDVCLTHSFGVNP